MNKKLIALAVAGAFALFFALRSALRMAAARRWRERATDTPPEGGRCSACDSEELEVLAPYAYRCLACGYEGGNGYAAWQAAQRRAEYARLDGPARRALATELVETAHRELEASRAASRDARELLAADQRPHGPGAVKGPSLTLSVESLAAAKRAAERGLDVVGGAPSPELAAIDLELDSRMLADDADNRGGGAGNRAAILARIEQLEADADRVGAAVARVEYELFAGESQPEG